MSENHSDKIKTAIHVANSLVWELSIEVAAVKERYDMRFSDAQEWVQLLEGIVADVAFLGEVIHQKSPNPTARDS